MVERDEASWQAVRIRHPRARPDRHGRFAAGLRRRAGHDGRVSRPPLTGALRRPALQITTGPVPDQTPQGAVVVAATSAAGSPTLTSLTTVEPEGENGHHGTLLERHKDG